MSHWSETHKPAAAAHAHLLFAGLMWTVVGVLLAFFGARWIWQARATATPWLVAGAVLIGVVKARMVLDRVARNIIRRILARGDGRCIGGFLSIRSWGLVAGMALAGRVLRRAALPAMKRSRWT